MLYGDVLYFSSQAGNVFACTADRRKSLLWSFPTEASLEADIAVAIRKASALREEKSFAPLP